MPCSSKMNKNIKFRILAFSLLVIWMIFIFVLSAQSADKSSETSGGFVSVIIKVVYPEFNKLSFSKQNDITYGVTLVVRKAAHFSEYFVLGVLSFLSAITFTKYKVVLRSAVAFILCVLYSISDELHQYFVPGRACRIGDVIIDCTGSLLAVLIFTFLFVKSNKIRSRLGEKDA